MKKYARVATIVLLLTMLASPLVALAASNIDNARFYGIITISNNSTATTNVATTANISTEGLIAGNYLNASANNCAVRSSSGADIGFMPSLNSTYPWCFWVDSIGANSYLSYLLYTANSTGGDIFYFPAAEGMFTLDDLTLELGDNFTIEQRGWVKTVFTDNYSERNLVNKPDAFKTYISAAENITSIMGSEIYLSFDGNDLVTITDHATLDMGAAQDFTIELWIKGSVANTLINKREFGGNIHGYFVDVAAEVATFTIRDVNAVNVGVPTPLPDDGKWHYIVGVYDRSGNLQTYTDGDPENNADITGVGNIDNGNPLYFGANRGGAAALIGDICEIRITKGLRTPGEITANWGSGSQPGGRVFNLDGTTVGLWHFDEGVGAALADATGVNGGVITNGTWVGDGFIFVTAANVSSDNHTIRTSANITHLKIFVDDMVTPKDTTPLTDNVTDNTENWTFCENDSFMYLEYQFISINGTERQNIVWEYAGVFQDSTAFDNDATPTFRGASSDLDVSANMTAFLPVSEAQAPAYVLGMGPGFVEEGITGNVTAPFRTVPSVPNGFPLAGVIRSIADATGTPSQLPLLIIAGFLILAASLTISGFLKGSGSGSLIAKTLVICAIMGILLAFDNFGVDLWMIAVVVIFSICTMMASRHYAWA